MENNPQKANRILYAVVVSVLCVVAIIVGIVAAANRTNTPPVTENPPVTDSTGPTTKPDDKPSSDQPAGEPQPIEYLCPVSGTVSQKHIVDDLIYSPSMNDWRTHPGMDIATALGEAVVASADGTVKEIWEDAMMGTCLSIEHGDGVLTVYKNLGAALAEGIEVGKTVKSGDTLGVVGETALCELADEPHLHFEMQVNGEVVNPLDYLSEESQSASLTFVEEDIYEE